MLGAGGARRRGAHCRSMPTGVAPRIPGRTTRTGSPVPSISRARPCGPRSPVPGNPRARGAKTTATYLTVTPGSRRTAARPWRAGLHARRPARLGESDSWLTTAFGLLGRTHREHTVSLTCTSEAVSRYAIRWCEAFAGYGSLGAGSLSSRSWTICARSAAREARCSAASARSCSSRLRISSAVRSCESRAPWCTWMARCFAAAASRRRCSRCSSSAMPRYIPVRLSS